MSIEICRSADQGLTLTNRVCHISQFSLNTFGRNWSKNFVKNYEYHSLSAMTTQPYNECDDIPQATFVVYLLTKSQMFCWRNDSQHALQGRSRFHWMHLRELSLHRTINHQFWNSFSMLCTLSMSKFSSPRSCFCTSYFVAWVCRTNMAGIGSFRIGKEVSLLLSVILRRCRTLGNRRFCISTLSSLLATR